jgi:hypothetical protein
MEIQAYADGLADMFCPYLTAQGNSSPKGGG